jgi:hypothetical protein
MPITVGTSSITFNDATVQTTAGLTSSNAVTSLNGQTGAVTNTSLYAIGSYVNGRTNSTSTEQAPDSTLAGSSLFSSTPSMTRRNEEGAGDVWNVAGAGGNYNITVAQVNTGTWRCMSRAVSTGGTGYAGLWVRIS